MLVSIYVVNSFVSSVLGRV